MTRSVLSIGPRLLRKSCLLHRHVSVHCPHHLLLPWYYFEGGNCRAVPHVHTKGIQHIHNKSLSVFFLSDGNVAEANCLA